MAYLDQSNDPRRRVTAIAGVAIIHAVLGLGVVTGLTVAGFAPPVDVWRPIVLTPDPTPTPTPPKPQASDQPTSSTVVAPQRPIDLPIPKDDGVATFDKPIDPPDGTGLKVTPTPTPMPSPTPSPFLQPRLARPSNDRNGWVTNNDYPAALLYREVEGTVGYKLIIGTNGKVSACDVTLSSGNGQLDDATCRLIARRARFEPATDGSGAKIMGSFSGTVLWQIPD